MANEGPKFIELTKVFNKGGSKGIQIVHEPFDCNANTIETMQAFAPRESVLPGYEDYDAATLIATVSGQIYNVRETKAEIKAKIAALNP